MGIIKGLYGGNGKSNKKEDGNQTKNWSVIGVHEDNYQCYVGFCVLS